MECVQKNTDLLIEFRKGNGGENDFYECSCQQNCVNSNINLDMQQALEGTTDLIGTIGAIILFHRYPLIRYKRKILFSFVDFLGKFLQSKRQNQIDFLCDFFSDSFDRRNSFIFHWFLCAWGNRNNLFLHA